MNTKCVNKACAADLIATKSRMLVETGMLCTRSVTMRVMQ